MNFLNHSVCFVHAVHDTTSAGYIFCRFGYHIIWWFFTLLSQSFSKKLNWTSFCRHTKMVCIFYIALTSNSNYIFCLNYCVPMISWDNSDMSQCPVAIGCIIWWHLVLTVFSRPPSGVRVSNVASAYSGPVYYTPSDPY